MHEVTKVLKQKLAKEKELHRRGKNYIETPLYELYPWFAEMVDSLDPSYHIVTESDRSTICIPMNKSVVCGGWKYTPANDTHIEVPTQDRGDVIIPGYSYVLQLKLYYYHEPNKLLPIFNIHQQKKVVSSFDIGNNEWKDIERIKFKVGEFTLTCGPNIPCIGRGGRYAGLTNLVIYQERPKPRFHSFEDVLIRTSDSIQ